MRSRPYTPPPPLPPLLDDLATVLPLPQKAYRSKDDADIPLDELDPETSRLIPTKRRTHKVWVQGRLAAVRSVSSLRSRSSRSKKDGGGGGGDGVDPNLVSGIPSPLTPEYPEEVDEESERETMRRARQLRGYGIGGIGNIRRPTDVIYGPDRPRTFFKSQPNLSTETSTPPASPLDDSNKRNLRDFFALRPDTKGKGRAA